VPAKMVLPNCVMLSNLRRSTRGDRVNGVSCAWLKCSRLCCSRCCSIISLLWIVVQGLVVSGLGTMSWVRPPGVVGFNICHTVAKQQRFSSACFIPRISCLHTLFLVAQATWIRLLRNSLCLVIAVLQISCNFCHACLCLLLIITGGVTVRSTSFSSSCMHS